MKRTLAAAHLLFLAFVLRSLGAHALAPAPSPSSAIPATPTIQARSNLVVLDVVVADRNHNPIHNLKVSDFQLREGGVLQAVKNFEEHSPGTAAPDPRMPALPPGVFTNYTATPNNGPVNILLIDRLNTPLKDQSFLHDQLLSFIRKMKPGTRLAVFGLNTQLIYLQGFTADPALLLAALEMKKNSPRSSPLLNNAVGDTTGSTAAAMEQFGSDIIPPAVIANVRQFEAEEASSKTQVRVRYTLDAMNVLARYLANLPGRKNLIWFSGSFPLSILPDASGDLTNPFSIAADMEDEFRETTNLLSRSQVAVYPIDVRGIQAAPMLDASNSGRQYARNPTAYGKDNSTFIQQTADEQITMRQMAHDTGGVAFVNTNGLAEAVSRAIDQGSSYYTLTYTPSDTSYDGRFRKIQVELAQRGVDLSYRRGYYADATDAKSGRQQLTTSAFAPPTAEHQAASNAMLRGAPGATQILFKALVVPAGAPTSEAVADGNQPAPTTKGPFRPYNVSYAAVAQNISMRTLAPGSYEAHVEFVTFVYDTSGGLVNRFSQSVRAKVDLQGLKTLSATGVQFHQVVSVPAKGDYFLRIGVHDLNNDHIGALEIPVAAVQNLAEIVPPAPATPAERPAPTLNTPPKSNP